MPGTPRVYLYVKVGNEVFRLSRSQWLCWLTDIGRYRDGALTEVPALPDYARDSFVLSYDLDNRGMSAEFLQRLLKEAE